MFRAIALCLAASLTVACGTPKTQYAWGDYQNSLHGMWMEPDHFDRAAHLGVLTKQIEQAEASELEVPPGVRAHVAMLYADLGNTAEARRYLLAEKEAFPESAVFVDGVLERMAR